MKNASSLIFSLIILLSVALGCGLVDRIQKTATENGNSNITLTDKAVDTAVGTSNTGVPECDEVLDLLAAEANNPDDNFVTKAIKATLSNKIRDSIKRNIEENNRDKLEVAKNCVEFKKQFDSFMAEEQKKTPSQNHLR